jgi:hypothetical protein
MSDLILVRIKKIIERNWRLILLVVLLLNFALRLLIYSKTILFSFSDYKSYLSAIDRIYNEGSIPIVAGNFLFTISYIGYFAKYFLGNLDIFFVFNCLLGTLTTYLIAILIFRLTDERVSGVISAILLTFYTEFMVFSSVFYTPVLMLFLLVLFTLLLYYYYKSFSGSELTLISIAIFPVFTATFLFKPELVFFPLFLFVFAFIFIKKQRFIFQRSLILVLILLAGILLIKASGIYKKPGGNAVANNFVFFGHTDYGGEGGEGSFILPENEVRYDEAWTIYCERNGINKPTIKDRNSFQLLEIKKFITHHPLKWTGLQFTKFFRTFGVVPESTSFKILYTGLLKGNLWLTSIVVVLPIAIIILLFILSFNLTALKNLLTINSRKTLDRRTARLRNRKINSFLYIYFLLFIYYILATIFIGQYQERYRMPVIVCFIIPLVSIFLSNFSLKDFLRKPGIYIRSAMTILFIAIWIFQAKSAISNTERLNNAIEIAKEAAEIE